MKINPEHLKLMVLSISLLISSSCKTEIQNLSCNSVEQSLEIISPEITLNTGSVINPDEIIRIKNNNCTKNDLLLSIADQSVAKIDSNGQISAQKEGNTIILVSMKLKPEIKKTLILNVHSSDNIINNTQTDTKASTDPIINQVMKDKTTEVPESPETFPSPTEEAKIPKVTKIIFSETKISLKINESRRADANVILSDNTTNKDIIWKSSDDLIAEVDPEGFIKGKNEGTVTITARSQQDGTISESITVKVYDSSNKSSYLSQVIDLATLSGKIVYASDIDGDTEIFSMNVNGLNKRQLTSNDFFDDSPAVSPDGDKIVFRSNSDGGWGIIKIKSDGSGRELISQSPYNMSPGWGPDNESIIMSSAPTTGGPWKITAHKTGTTDYFELAEGIEPSVNQDLSKIVFEKDGIKVRDSETGLSMTIADGYEPKFSPVENKIVFVNTSSKICTINQDGSSLSVLTSGSRPNWSPDGKYIIYINRVDDNSEIFIMKSDGSFQTRVTFSPENESVPSWSK